MTWEEVKAAIENDHLFWLKLFDERQVNEIHFDYFYAEKYAHGTDGHNARMIIARMTELLDLISNKIKVDE